MIMRGGDRGQRASSAGNPLGCRRRAGGRRQAARSAAAPWRYAIPSDLLCRRAAQAGQLWSVAWHAVAHPTGAAPTAGVRRWYGHQRQRLVACMACSPLRASAAVVPLVAPRFRFYRPAQVPGSMTSTRGAAPEPAMLCPMHAGRVDALADQAGLVRRMPTSRTARWLDVGHLCSSAALPWPRQHGLRLHEERACCGAGPAQHFARGGSK